MDLSPALGEMDHVVDACCSDLRCEEEGRMQIEERTIGDIVILSLSGDVVLGEASTSLATRVRHVLGQSRRRIVLDLTHVRYVDSAGLGDIVAAFAAAKNRGGWLRLVGVTRRLSDLLVLTKLLTVFDCFDTLNEAIGSDACPHVRVH